MLLQRAKLTILFVIVLLSTISILTLPKESVHAAVRKPTPIKSGPTPTPTKIPTPTPKPTSITTPTPTQSIPTPTPTVNTKLGGMNLDGYCNSINIPGVVLNNNTWYCGSTSSAINMSAACQWQYNRSNAYANQDTAGNPYSWTCYAPTGSITPTPQPTATPTPIKSGPTPTQSVPTPTMTNTPTPTPTPSGNYYLALGDSLAFGFHLVQFQQEEASNSYNPASFNDGYDADYFTNLRAILSPIQEINYSCPGETTDSFINGGCPNHTQSLSLHSNYPVSQPQLQPAINFLQSHPGSISSVTIDIGVNDAINVANICQAQSDPVSCYNANTPGVLAKVQQNYDIILNALLKVSSPSNLMIVKFPNPVYYDGSDNLVNGLNQIQDNEASSRGLRIADAYSIFTANNICSYTNFCASPSDFHPTALGYQAMANQIWSASGYASK